MFCELHRYFLPDTETSRMADIMMEATHPGSLLAPFTLQTTET
jgi:hypothetical protein